MMPPRGPVLVSIPADDRAVLTERAAPRQVSTELQPQPELLLHLGDALDASKRPAFTYPVEGQGPHLPEGATLCQITDDPQTAAWAPTGTLLQTVTELRGRDSIVVEEAPSARHVMHDCLPIHASETFYTVCSGGLGWSLPAAVDVALAKPGRRVIALIGDGSAMYAIQALWSAAQLALPITIVILKSRRYAALQEFAPTFGFGPQGRLQGRDLPGLDFVALATGHGCKAARVEQGHELHGTLAATLRSSGPMLLEVEVA